MSSTYTVINPATEEQVTEVHLATLEETDTAIERAAEVYPAWREMPPGERATLLRRFAALVDEHVDELEGFFPRRGGSGPGPMSWRSWRYATPVIPGATQRGRRATYAMSSTTTRQRPNG